MMDFQFLEIVITSVIAIYFGILKLLFNKISSDIISINNELTLINKTIANLQEELNSIKINTSKTYLEKDDFKYTFDNLSRTFEKIFDKLEKKKDEC